MNQCVQFIKGYVEWNSGFKEFQFESIKNTYEEIAKLVHSPDIVIICDKKLCSQKDTFGEIQNKIGCGNKLILHTIKIEDILNLQVEINELKQRIEAIHKMHQLEIDELQSKILQSTAPTISIEQSQTFEQSMALEQQYSCHYCDMLIEESTIQLNCFHCFHDRCLGNLLHGQLIIGVTSFSCLCGIKIKQKELRSLQNQFAAYIYQLQLQLNQLQILQANYNLKKCPSTHCTFLYYYDEKLPDQNYCPLCLD